MNSRLNTTVLLSSYVSCHACDFLKRRSTLISAKGAVNDTACGFISDQPQRSRHPRCSTGRALLEERISKACLTQTEFTPRPSRVGACTLLDHARVSFSNHIILALGRLAVSDLVLIPGHGAASHSPSARSRTLPPSPTGLVLSVKTCGAHPPPASACLCCLTDLAGWCLSASVCRLHDPFRLPVPPGRFLMNLCMGLFVLCMFL